MTAVTSGRQSLDLCPAVATMFVTSRYTGELGGGAAGRVNENAWRGAGASAKAAKEAAAACSLMACGLAVPRWKSRGMKAELR